MRKTGLIAFVVVMSAVGSLVPAAVRPARAAAAGSVAVSIGDVRIAEGNSGTQVAQVPLVLSQAAATNVSISYAVVDDSATHGEDWLPQGASTGTLVLRPGAVAKLVNVKIVGDTVPESDEQVRIQLTNVVGAPLPLDDTGTVTILDDDTAPAVGVSLGDVVMPEGDTKSRTVKVPITLSAPAASDVTIVLTRRPSSTAVRFADDKTPLTKSVLIRAGKSSGTVPVPVLGDVVREHDEAVTIEASSSLPIARGTGTVTIRDEASDAGAMFAAGPTDNLYVPPALGRGPAGELVWSKVLSTDALATQHLIGYRSIGQRGRPIYVTARVFVPAGAEPPGGREVVAWAEGTTGLGDACAPSLVGGIPAVTNLLSAGYVVVATDYEGLGTPGAHAYNSAQSEAQTILDSIRAVPELGVRTTGRAVIYGGSRGGHAALATAERRAYAPDIEVLGAIGLGAGAVKPTDDGLVDYAVNSYYKGFLMMYLRGVQQLYGAGNTAVKSLLNYYLTPFGVQQLPQADACVGPVIPYFGNISSVQLFRLSRPPIPTDANLLRQNATVGAIGSEVPIVLMSGLSDTIVPPTAIDDWHSWACAQPGRTGPIEKRWYNSGHFPTPTSDIVNWIADRFAGLAAADSC